MPPVGSFMLGAFAVFIAWTLVRALQSGTIFSDGVPCNANEQPMEFASVAAIHCGGAVLFAWLAASDGIPVLWRLVGAQ